MSSPGIDTSTPSAACVEPDQPTKQRRKCLPGQCSWWVTLHGIWQPPGHILSPRACRPKVKAFLLKNFLVIGLVSAIVFSLACPWPGRAVNSVKVGDYKVFSTINIITIFVISGLTLRTEEIKDALTKWWALLIGLVSIMLITPCAAFALVELPFSNPVYAYGLAIFALVPTTIASGITLVQGEVVGEGGRGGASC